MTLIKKPFWIVSLAVLIIFWIGALVSEAKELAEFLRVFQMSLAIAVVVSYSRDAWASAMKPVLNADDLLLLGIVCAWLGSFFIGGWLLLWRLSGQPSWMVNSDFQNSLVVLQTYGAVLHLLAPGAIGGVVPRKNMIKIGALTGIACLSMVIIISLTPVVRVLVHAVRPMIEQPHNTYEAPVSFRL